LFVYLLVALLRADRN
ncbi:MAG: potassium-transporting ATPase subunit F, partial [Pseudomonas sp.]|nr:potassium-transporting ATPase subunit F [Pseudomonas sp.]